MTPTKHRSWVELRRLEIHETRFPVGDHSIQHTGHYETYDAQVRALSESQREISGMLHTYLTNFICNKADPNALSGPWAARPTWDPYWLGARPKTMIFGTREHGTRRRQRQPRRGQAGGVDLRGLARGKLYLLVGEGRIDPAVEHAIRTTTIIYVEASPEDARYSEAVTVDPVEWNDQ